MIKASGASFGEKLLIKKVEKGVFEYLKQKNFFLTDLSISGADEIRELNRRARNVDAVTDVLSFPEFDKLQPPVCENSFSETDYDGRRVFLGSIMICRERAKEQAEEFGHSYARELGFLTCHGLLHLMGFDHIESEDEKEMLKAQRAVMKNAGLSR